MRRLMLRARAGVGPATATAPGPRWRFPRQRVLGCFFVFALLAFAFAPQPAQALSPCLTGDFQNCVANIAAHTLYPVIQFLGNFLITLINILVAVAAYNDFVRATTVEKGFVIVRDLANMFFIVILLIIAVGTILNLQQYKYNRLLGRLIITAFLVQYARFILGFLIDIAQVVMLTFVNAFRLAAAGNLTTAFGLNDLLTLRDVSPSSVTGYALIGALLLALALLIVALIVVGVYVVVFIIRIIALWLLIILSPLAFVLRTFPAGQSYANQWWEKFTKYVICGPVIAFFLWLTLTVVATTSPGESLINVNLNAGEISSNTAVVNTGGTGGPVASAITKVSQSDHLLSYIVAILLLFSSMTIAQQLCGAAGKFVGQWSDRAKRAALVGTGVVAGVGLAKKGWGLTKEGVRGGLGAAGRRIESVMPGGGPRGILREIRRRAEESRKTHETRMGLRARDLFERTPRGAAFSREALFEASLQEERKKRFQGITTKDQFEGMAGHLMQRGSQQDRAAFLSWGMQSGMLDRRLKDRSSVLAKYHAGTTVSGSTVYNNLLDEWVGRNTPERSMVEEAAVLQKRFQYVTDPTERERRLSELAPTDAARASVETFVTEKVRKKIDGASGIISTTGPDVAVTAGVDRAALRTRRSLNWVGHNNALNAQEGRLLLGSSDEDARMDLTVAGKTIKAKSRLVDQDQWDSIKSLIDEDPKQLAALVKRENVRRIGNISTGESIDLSNLYDPGFKPDERIQDMHTLRLSTRPGAAPGEQEVDWLRGASHDEYEATKAKAQAYQARGQNFFESEEYKQAQAKFVSEEDFRVGQKLEATPATDVTVGSFGQGRNVLAVNLDKVGGGKFSDRAYGMRLKSPEQIRPFLTEVSGMVGQEIAELETKTERTALEDARLRELRGAKARMDEAVRDPSLIPRLRVVNTSRRGGTGRHVYGHEAYHEKFELLGEGTIDEFMRQESPEDLKRIQLQMQQKMRDPAMDLREAYEEYLVEGMTNRRKSMADTAPDAVTLNDATIQRVMAAGQRQGVDLTKVMDIPRGRRGMIEPPPSGGRPTGGPPAPTAPSSPRPAAGPGGAAKPTGPAAPPYPELPAYEKIAPVAAYRTAALGHKAVGKGAAAARKVGGAVVGAADVAAEKVAAATGRVEQQVVEGATNIARQAAEKIEQAKGTKVGQAVAGTARTVAAGGATVAKKAAAAASAVSRAPEKIRAKQEEAKAKVIQAYEADVAKKQAAYEAKRSERQSLEGERQQTFAEYSATDRAMAASIEELKPQLDQAVAAGDDLRATDIAKQIKEREVVRDGAREMIQYANANVQQAQREEEQLRRTAEQAAAESQRQRDRLTRPPAPSAPAPAPPATSAPTPPPAPAPAPRPASTAPAAPAAAEAPPTEPRRGVGLGAAALAGAAGGLAAGAVMSPDRGELHDALAGLGASLQGLQLGIEDLGKRFEDHGRVLQQLENRLGKGTSASLKEKLTRMQHQAGETPADAGVREMREKEFHRLTKEFYEQLLESLRGHGAAPASASERRQEQAAAADEQPPPKPPKPPRQPQPPVNLPI